MNGGSFLYPEFTCSGTLNSVTIPYLIMGLTGRQWENNLELTLAIWRKNVGGYYVQVGGDLLLREQINTNRFGYLTEVTQTNATKQININIQKHDILLLTGRNYTYYNLDDSSAAAQIFRRHIPALLATYELPGSSETVTIPMIHVDFSEQSGEGDLLHTFMCESAPGLTHCVCLSILRTISPPLHILTVTDLHADKRLYNTYSCRHNGPSIPSINVFKVSTINVIAVYITLTMSNKNCYAYN